jgi:MFS family permease
VITIADALASEMSLQIRQTVSRHRRQKQSLERAGSLQSRRGLDWMNFFTADVQTGFGAFVSLYLAELQWSQQSVGFALTIGRISGVIGMIPAGALADSIRSKRGLAAAGLLIPPLTRNLSEGCRLTRTAQQSWVVDGTGVIAWFDGCRVLVDFARHRPASSASHIGAGRLGLPEFLSADIHYRSSPK